MIAAIFTTVRLVLVWFLVYLFTMINLAEAMRPFRSRFLEGISVIGGFVVALAVLSIACSHVLRVRLVAGRLDATALSARQRRQVEIPFEAGEAFDLVDAAVR